MDKDVKFIINFVTALLQQVRDGNFVEDRIVKVCMH